MTRCAPLGSWLSTALHAAMPDENDTAWPPSSPPRTSSKASQVSVASVRLYRRSVPSTKFDAGTSGVFRGAPGTRSGRPPTMAQVSGFTGASRFWLAAALEDQRRGLRAGARADRAERRRQRERVSAHAAADLDRDA